MHLPWFSLHLQSVVQNTLIFLGPDGHWYKSWSWVISSVLSPLLWPILLPLESIVVCAWYLQYVFTVADLPVVFDINSTVKSWSI